jgi:PTH1 family peptidyl-tRNA hydrolase
MLDNHKLILCQPQTYMNLSGEAVKEIAGWHKIIPAHIIVAYDDVDLDTGRLRLREGGSSGGHHGIDSIIQHLGFSDFLRVRMGISRPAGLIDVADHVLQQIPSSEKQVLSEAVLLAADAIEAIVQKGLAPAMDSFN